MNQLTSFFRGEKNQTIISVASFSTKSNLCILTFFLSFGFSINKNFFNKTTLVKKITSDDYKTL